MTQTEEIEISIDDSHIITNNQLGMPLTIYKIGRMYISLYYWASIILFLMSIGILLLIILGSLYETSTRPTGWTFGYFQFFFSQYLFFPAAFPAFLSFVSAQVAGWFLWLVVVPQAREDRIIVCEKGLLHIGWKVRGRNIQAIRWRDIQTISQDYLLYSKDTTMKMLRLDSGYQGFDELMALIKQRTNEVGE